MLEDDGSPPQGTHPLISTRASGSISVLMLDVEDGGCDARPGGLGGGAPLSTNRIYKHLIQFQKKQKHERQKHERQKQKKFQVEDRRCSF